MPTIFKYEKKKRSYQNKKNNDNHNLVYNTRQWKILRLNYLKNSPYCTLCFQNNKLELAVDVHHIKPFAHITDNQEKLKLAFDYNNLMGLCKECHKLKHSKKIIN